MNELMTRVFENEEFGKVRTIMLEGEPWFVAVDVCKALEISDTGKATSRLDEDELTRIKIGSGGQSREVIAVNEPGVYALVLGSRKPSAKAFKRWITHEVIPSIRKHGAYMTTDTVERMLQDPAWSIRLLQEIQSEREKSAQLALKIEEDRPKVEFAETVRGSSKCMRIGDFSKFLQQRGVDIKPHQLFELLRRDGYLMRKGTDNVPTQKSISMGLMQMREYPVYKAGGRVEIKITPLLTGKGQLYFMEKYGWNNVGNGAMIGGAAFVQNGV